MVAMVRPSWIEYHLGFAEAASKRADCRRSKVGAVLIDVEQRLISAGYNGVAPGAPGCLAGACPRGLQSYEELPQSASYSDAKAPCIAWHAERNAYADAVRRSQQHRLIGGTAYITRDPCVDCVALLKTAGIYLIVWPTGTMEL